MKKRFFAKNLAIFALPLLIPLLLLGSFSFFITQSFIREDINKGNVKMLNQSKETVELLFNELDSLSLNFNLNPLFISKFKNLLENDVMSIEDIEASNTFMNLINPPSNSKPYIQSIYVYFQNSRRNFLVSNQGIANLDSFIDKSWYERFLSLEGDVNTWIETRTIKQYEFEKEGTHLITIYKKLYSPGIAKADGVMIMNIKQDYLEKMLKSLVSYPQQAVLILDGKDRVIAGGSTVSSPQDIDMKKINENPSEFFQFRSAKNSYTVSQIKSDRYALKYMSVIPREALYKLPITLVNVTILLLLVSLLLGLALTYYITRKNYNNIRSIISAFESAENGSPLPALPSRVKDEYGYIMQNIIKTFIEQSYLKVQLSEKKYKLKAMEILALQSQINPHFLFNTLKTIFWKSISLTGEQNEVSKMIEYLSEILHYSLGPSDKAVTLEEEIRNTQSYIEIQKVRYKDKFRVLWQYDEALTQHKVLKLLFQPFIENCIYHGIKEKEGVSFIKIKIRQVQSGLKITIIDTGLGIPKEELVKIRQKLMEEGESGESAGHIGMFNTHKRLILTYGEESGIKIQSKYGLGTVIHIRIPV